MEKKTDKSTAKTAVEKSHDQRSGDKKDESPVDTAVSRIKEMMYHHEIVPGQKLLYRELAGKLNMSVTPIIQALNRLQFMNIVRSERNKGYYVDEANPQEARELFMAREALETYLVPTIIKGITDVKLDAIKKAMDAHAKGLSVSQYRRNLMLVDTSFHLKIIECSENMVFYDTCKSIFERIYLKYRPEFMKEDRLKEAAEEHKMLFEALKSRDVTKFRRLSKQHIKNGSKHIVGSLWQDRNIHAYPLTAESSDSIGRSVECVDGTECVEQSESAVDYQPDNSMGI